jgi:hypothetical protein
MSQDEAIDNYVLLLKRFDKAKKVNARRSLNSLRQSMIKRTSIEISDSDFQVALYEAGFELANKHGTNSCKVANICEASLLRYHSLND